MRPVYVIPAVLSMLLLAACATERLAASAPQGVNLSGDWSFDPNLSDDPSKLGGDNSGTTPQRAPGGRHGRGGRGGPGMPPMGGPGGGYNYLPTALRDQDTGPQPAEPAAEAPPARGATNATAPRGRGPDDGSRSLRAPSHMLITQKDDSVIIRATTTDGKQLVEEYKAGTSSTITYGATSTAKRTAGWRGPVFVVRTEPNKGGSREDDFALDEQDHLIMTTQTRGGGHGSTEIKRVYDRLRGAGS